jgi:hypothetical protein
MLTAWAVAEIPTLEIDGYRDASTDGVDRVVCRTTDDRVVSISSPLTAPAAELQDAEHRVGQLLGAGVRDRLPFAVPHTLAAGSLDTRRIVVTEEVGGTPLSSVKDPRPVFSSLAAAMAASDPSTAPEAPEAPEELAAPPPFLPLSPLAGGATAAGSQWLSSS